MWSKRRRYLCPHICSFEFVDCTQKFPVVADANSGLKREKGEAGMVSDHWSGFVANERLFGSKRMRRASAVGKVRARCRQCEVSKHFPLLHLFLGSQRDPQFAFHAAGDQRCHMLANRRAMLESVTRPAANEPGVFKPGVTVN